ncbi:MAG: DUF177 domain-containing protein [Alphaproteobacteria bacterium]|nr:DUF177 domain-containing protein [Alphaproteobacteria bacterium]MBV8549400.1 DUF177 domain-containing protein [Alphaproteobacteria bacterium]
MKRQHTPDYELSRPLVVDKISSNGVEDDIKATPKERAALAARFGLIDLPMLRARLQSHASHAGAVVSVVGRLEADVVQPCVVTLEPVAAHIEQDIDVKFSAIDTTPEASAIQHDADEDDVEPIEGGVIDLGELVAQHLGIALNPYPRKEGVAFDEAEMGAPPSQQAANDAGKDTNNPFARLVELQKNRDKSDK